MARIDYVEAFLWVRPAYLIGPAQLRFEGHGRQAGHHGEVAHAMVQEAAAEAARRISPAWHTEEVMAGDAERIADFRARFPGIDVPDHWLDYRADLHISPGSTTCATHRSELTAYTYWPPPWRSPPCGSAHCHC